MEHPLIYIRGGPIVRVIYTATPRLRTLQAPNVNMCTTPECVLHCLQVRGQVGSDPLIYESRNDRCASIVHSFASNPHTATMVMTGMCSAVWDASICLAKYLEKVGAYSTHRQTLACTSARDLG